MIHHLALLVRDLEGAERFWSGVVGLPLVRRSERSIWLDLGGGAILMLERTAAVARSAPAWQEEAPGWRLCALAIRPEERAALEARLAAAGVAIAHRTDSTIYVQDPEGNRLGFSHFPEAAAESEPSRGAGESPEPDARGRGTSQDFSR